MNSPFTINTAALVQTARMNTYFKLTFTVIATSTPAIPQDITSILAVFTSNGGIAKLGVFRRASGSVVITYGTTSIENSQPLLPATATTDLTTITIVVEPTSASTVTLRYRSSFLPDSEFTQPGMAPLDLRSNNVLIYASHPAYTSSAGVLQDITIQSAFHFVLVCLTLLGNAFHFSFTLIQSCRSRPSTAP